MQIAPIFRTVAPGPLFRHWERMGLSTVSRHAVPGCQDEISNVPFIGPRSGCFGIPGNHPHASYSVLLRVPDIDVDMQLFIVTLLNLLAFYLIEP
jgi:hypothetical protein